MPRRAPDHAHDAGGDPRILADKARLRKEVWSRLETKGVWRFPGPTGRIPNFVGAERAAEQLRSLDAWQQAATMKANPDAPQRPVRQRALEDGKVVFMAVPRLASAEPFLLLDPDVLTTSPRAASSINGASKHGRPVAVDELEPVALVVTGCVAVSEDGARLGKGGGFSDLELAIATAAGLVDDTTVIVTTVHEQQLVERGRIPMSSHDIRLDYIATPERLIAVGGSGRRVRPEIQWEELTDDKVRTIPILSSLQQERRR